MNDAGLKRTLSLLFVYSFVFALLTASLLQSRVEPVWDAADLCYPSFSYLSDALKEGRLPLWDPTTNCGEPFHADPSRWTLSPIALPLAYFMNSPLMAFKLFWLFHWWLAGITMFWCARALGATGYGCLLSAMLYTFSGFFVGNAASTTLIVFAAWLPLIVAFADMAAARRSMSAALAAGVVFGIAALDGGYPGLLIMAGIGLALWLSLRYLVFPERQYAATYSLVERLTWVAGILCIMCALLALSWSPYLSGYFTETAGINDRIAGLDAHTAINNNPFTIQALLSVLYPFSTILYSGFSNLFYGDNWMGTDIAFANAYMGVITVPLAWVYWKHSDSERKPLWMAVIIVFMFLASLGGAGGVRTLLYYLVPPMRYMRYNGAFRLFWMLPLILAAGLGFSIAWNNIAALATLFRAVVWWSAVSAVVAGAITWFPLSRGFPAATFLPRLLLPAAAVIPLLLIFCWLWKNRGQATGYETFALIIIVISAADVSGHLFTNSMTVWCEGCKNLAATEWEQHNPVNSYRGPPPPRNNKGQSFTNQISKNPVVIGYSLFTSREYNALAESSYAEILQAPFRFWLTPGGQPVQDRSRVLQVLKGSGRGQPLPSFIDNHSDDEAAPVVAGSYGSVRVNHYAPESIELQIYVPGHEKAFLASSERYAPGWNVFIDGVPAHVNRVNLFFRGVEVPAGGHTINWKYEPKNYRLLVVISYSGTFILFCLALLLARKANR